MHSHLTCKHFSYQMELWIHWPWGHTIWAISWKPKQTELIWSHQCLFIIWSNMIITILNNFIAHCSFFLYCRGHLIITINPWPKHHWVTKYWTELCNNTGSTVGVTKWSYHSITDISQLNCLYVCVCFGVWMCPCYKQMNVISGSPCVLRGQNLPAVNTAVKYPMIKCTVCVQANSCIQSKTWFLKLYIRMYVSWYITQGEHYIKMYLFFLCITYQKESLFWLAILIRLVLLTNLTSTLI